MRVAHVFKAFLQRFASFKWRPCCCENYQMSEEWEARCAKLEGVIVLLLREVKELKSRVTTKQTRGDRRIEALEQQLLQDVDTRLTVSIRYAAPPTQLAGVSGRTGRAAGSARRISSEDRIRRGVS